MLASSCSACGARVSWECEELIDRVVLSVVSHGEKCFFLFLGKDGKDYFYTSITVGVFL